MNTIIYAMLDPRDGAAFYVGQTRTTLRKRLVEHRSASKRRRLPVERTVGEILDAGLLPGAVELEVALAGLDADAAEAFHVAALRAAGARIANVSSGGPGGSGTIRSARQRVAAAEAKRRTPVSEETRAKLRAAKAVAGLMSTNTSGIRGVSQTKRGKWVARLFVDGRNLCGGTFATADEAAAARRRMVDQACGVAS